MAYSSPVIWGNIYDNKGKPISGGLVKLVQKDEENPKQASVIRQTKTDINGYYELELPIPVKCNYHILISSTSCAQKVEKINRNNICYYQ